MAYIAEEKPNVLNFFDLPVLLGALQGFIISSLLIFSKNKSLADKLLGSLLLLLSLASLNIYLIGQKWFQNNPTLVVLHEIIPLVIVMPVGPLIYFYVRSWMDPHFSLDRKRKAHFYPVILDLFQHLVVVFYIVGVSTQLIRPNNPAWATFIDQYNTYVDIPRWISLSFYIVLTWNFIKKKQKTAKASGLQQDAAWPRQFVFVFALFQVVWLIHLVPYLIPSLSNKLLDMVSWYPIFVPMSILIYWLGFKGFLLVRREGNQIKKGAALLSTLTEEKIVEAATILQKSMEEDRIFLDPELNLHKLSLHTGLAQKTISAVLNQRLNKSFSDFVNEFRVEEIKQKILRADTRHLTISGIAYDCGFNSQPTFHRAFKSITGITPKEFLSRHIQIQE